MTDTLVSNATRQAAGQRKVWRNRYKLARAIINTLNGEVVGPGEVLSGESYPSKELAEAMAKVGVGDDPRWKAAGHQYLGAVETDE